MPHDGAGGLRHTEKLIALTVDGNGAYVYLDPYEGGKIVVTEAARNLACSGAAPLGVTDNLNYGNPMKPELFWQLKESVRGLADACRAFNTPVTGGNCSLYNQSPAGPIDPTPTVAMVGLIEKPEHITTQWFKDEGDAIILLGEPVDTSDPLLGLGGSAYLQAVQGMKTGTPPRCDLETAKTLHTTLLGLIQSGLVKSAHDCSEGGLAVCLAESCISQLVARETPRLIGATVDLSCSRVSSERGQQRRRPRSHETRLQCRLDALLFGETQIRVVITCQPLDAVKVIERAKLMGVPAVQIGKVGGDRLIIRTAAGEFGAPVTELHDVWWNAIARAMANEMSPFTHFVGSWLIASATTDNPRDRKLVTLAGILPDWILGTFNGSCIPDAQNKTIQLHARWICSNECLIVFLAALWLAVKKGYSFC